MAQPQKSKEAPSLVALKKFYAEGNLPAALALSVTLASENPKEMENVGYLLCYAQILSESEGPTSKIKSLLGKALMLEPQNAQVNEYLELTEAKSMLTKEKGDLGEKKLLDLLRRSPDNPHALFFLGAHLFWTLDETLAPVRHLERCVRIHPKFLRAWGCLGTIYEKLGNPTHSVKAFSSALAVETDLTMRDFFKQKIESLSAL